MGSDVPPGALTEPVATEVPERPRSGATFAPTAPSAPAARSTARDYAEVVLVAVIFALFVRTFLVQAFVVPTPSMEDTVLVGDHLVVNKFIFARHRWGRFLPYRELARGDVFVFKFPEDPQRDFIKRAIALPGDVLEIRDKSVFVDGEKVSEPKAGHSDPHVWGNDRDLPDSLRRRDQLAPMRVPSESIFAMGDNRDSSYDSRFWGPVPSGNVKGRALFVYWSFAPPPAGPATGLWSKLKGLPARTRWNRTLLPVR